MILDPSNRGFVVTTSCRFHAIASLLPSPSTSKFAFSLKDLLSSSRPQLNKSPPVALEPTSILVHLPQMDPQTLIYTWRGLDDGKGQLEGCGRNAFVEAALEGVLSMFPPPIGNDIALTLAGDAGFYSSHVTDDHWNHTLPHGCKTGLGSSAALTTAAVASLLAVLAPNDSVQLDDLHAIALEAHHKAQGKIGSGFDVAAACYGAGFFQRGGAFVKTDLPDGLELSLGDVAGGSSTPGMVTAVKGVREDGRGKDVWNALVEANRVLMNVFETGDGNLAAAHGSVRALMKELGQIAEVGIEPDDQTERIVESLKVQGVVTAGVPGAGGTDALFALHDPEARPGLQARWRELGIEPLPVSLDSRGVCLGQSSRDLVKGNGLEEVHREWMLKTLLG